MPDSLLSAKASAGSLVVSTGMEITEAISPNLEQAIEIQTKCYPNAALDASLFQWRERLGRLKAAGVARGAMSTKLP